MQKLIPKYLSSYEIVKVISPTAYRVALPLTLQIHLVFHILLLKRHIKSDDYPQILLPLPVTIGDEDEYEVKQKKKNDFFKIINLLLQFLEI